MKRKTWLANSMCVGLFIVALQICSGCDNDNDDISGSGSGSESSSQPNDEKDNVDNSDFSSEIRIAFGSSPIVTNPLDGNGVSITADGDQITIQSTAEEVEYILSGITTAGSVKIESDYKFKLTLNGVQITNPNGPAVNIQSGKRAFVELKEGSVNKLTDGTAYKEVSGEDMKGAFFSEGQLLFSGTGSLQVEGNYKHAICSDDYVRIYQGDITAISTVSDGIHTNDAFVMDGGNLTIRAATDGIECEKGHIIINDGTITIQSGDDGIAASYEEGDTSIDPYLEIYKGTISVTTTGTSAKAIKSRGNLTIYDGTIKVKTSKSEAEGIESKKTLTIHGGQIEVEAYDDCINAATSIEIHGGDIYCYSMANDGIDSNGTLTITGGRIIAIGTSSPEEGIDCDHNTFKITGGTVLGFGGATSSPTANVSSQRSVVYAGSGAVNTLFHIASSSGEGILTYTIPRALQQMTILFSSPLITEGSYTIYSGGSVSGGTNFHGLYENATYSNGTQSTTFSASSMVTTVGSFQGGPGGNPGGPGRW